MPWCPKCKSEYVTGTECCADCGSPLTDRLEETKEEKEELWVDRKGLLRGSAETEDADELCADGSPSETKSQQLTPAYESARSRAEEHRSGAYTLLITGTVGLLADLCLFSGILPLSMTTFSRYLTCGVMGVLFAVFLWMGVSSLRSWQALTEKADREEDLESQIRQWCLNHLYAAQIDASLEGEDSSLSPEDMGAEMLYFSRIERMKELILEQFGDLQENYLDHLTDLLYPEIFQDASV